MRVHNKERIHFKKSNQLSFFLTQMNAKLVRKQRGMYITQPEPENKKRQNKRCTNRNRLTASDEGSYVTGWFRYISLIKSSPEVCTLTKNYCDFKEMFTNNVFGDLPQMAYTYNDTFLPNIQIHSHR